MSTPEPLLLKAAEAAALLNVSVSTLHRLILGGELKAVKRGRIVRVSRQAIDEFIRHQESGTPADSGQVLPFTPTPLARVR